MYIEKSILIVCVWANSKLALQQILFHPAPGRLSVTIKILGQKTYLYP